MNPTYVRNSYPHCTPPARLINPSQAPAHTHNPSMPPRLTTLDILEPTRRLTVWLNHILEQRDCVPHLRRIRILYRENWPPPESPKYNRAVTFMSKEQVLQSEVFAEMRERFAEVGIVLEIGEYKIDEIGGGCE